MEVTLKVPDMTCDHCKMTIEKALTLVSGVDQVRIKLPEKVVNVSGKIEVNSVVDAIRKAGYNADEIIGIKP